MSFGFLKTLVKSLRFKLTVWNTLVVLLVAILALVSVQFGIQSMLLRELDGVLRDEAHEILLTIEQSYPNQDEIFDQLERKSAVHRQHGWFVQLLDGSNKIIWASRSTPETILNRSVQRSRSRMIFAVGSYRVAQQQLENNGLPDYVVRVGTSTEFIDQDVARVTRIAAPVGAVVLLLAPLGGFLLSGRATQPLQKIIRTTEGLRPHHMNERLPIRDTGDELDQLSRKINAFLDKIADYLQYHRDFIANAAHELRSPLTAILSSVEITVGKDRSSREYIDLLDSIHEECTRLTTLVNQLLLLAESDAGDLEQLRAPVALDEIVLRSLDMFAGVADEQNIQLTWHIEPKTIVSVDAGQLRQVVNNVLDNAIKFTPPGKQVTLTLQSENAQSEVVLTVRDEGVGIPSEHLPRIFERFCQVDKSRQRAVSHRGGGLGLSICRSILNAHGGAIDVKSQLDVGTTVVVRLPISPKPSESQVDEVGQTSL